jgi:outer membrane lipoprotein-sorting protein
MPIPIKPLALSSICLATLLVTMSGQQAALVAKTAAPAPKVAARPAPLDQAAQLKSTIEKLDAASKRFKSAEATVHKVAHDRLTGDDIQDGTIYFEGRGASTEMAYKITGPNPTTIHFDDGALRVLQKDKDCILLHQAGIDTYLTLGFGGSGTDLAKAWNITDLGPEKIGGTEVEKLDLIAKDPKVRANVTKFTLWVDLSRAISLRQVFYQAGTGDTWTADYTNIRYNQSINKKPYKFEEKNCKPA